MTSPRGMKRKSAGLATPPPPDQAIAPASRASRARGMINSRDIAERPRHRDARAYGPVVGADVAAGAVEVVAAAPVVAAGHGVRAANSLMLFSAAGIGLTRGTICAPGVAGPILVAG